jgi:hypothetical protein
MHPLHAVAWLLSLEKGVMFSNPHRRLYVFKLLKTTIQIKQSILRLISYHIKLFYTYLLVTLTVNLIISELNTHTQKKD